MQNSVKLIFSSGAWISSTNKSIHAESQGTAYLDLNSALNIDFTKPYRTYYSVRKTSGESGVGSQPVTMVWYRTNETDFIFADMIQSTKSARSVFVRAWNGSIDVSEVWIEYEK